MNIIVQKAVDVMYRHNALKVMKISKMCAEMGSEGEQAKEAAFRIGSRYRMRGGGWARILAFHEDRLAGEISCCDFLSELNRTIGHWMWNADGYWKSAREPHRLDLVGERVSS